MTGVSEAPEKETRAMTNRAISVVGLGKLGAPLAASLASKGLRVIGVDTDPHKVEMINRGQAPVFEPRLEEFIQSSREFLSATGGIEEAVLASRQKPKDPCVGRVDGGDNGILLSLRWYRRFQERNNLSRTWPSL